MEAAEAGGEAAAGGGGVGDFLASLFGGGVGDAGFQSLAPGASEVGGVFGGDVAGAAASGAESLGNAAGTLGSTAGGFGDAAGTLGTFGGDAAGAVGGATNVASGATGTGIDAGLITSNAALNTGAASPFAGGGDAVGSASPFGSGSAALPGSNAAGQPLAAGGTSAVSGPAASIDPSAVTSAPTSGTGAASLAPASGPSATGTAPADATSSWADMLKKGLTSNPLGAALGAAGLGYNILQGQKQTANQGALTDAARQAAANNTKLTDAGIAQVGANTANANKLTDLGVNQTQANIANNTKIQQQGQALTEYLTTGKLPAEYTTQIDQAINDAKTTAISNAAKNGQPTDPTKNTSLAQQLAQIENARAGETSKIAERLFGSGTNLINTGTGANTNAASNLLGSGVNTNIASASSLLSGGQNAANLSGQLYTTLTGIDSKQSEQTAKAIAALAQSLNAGGTQKQAVPV